MKKHYEDIGFAKVDHHRPRRKGFPETIYCAEKTPAQVAKIAQTIWARGHNVLATRADRKAFLAVKKVLKKAHYHETARIITALNPKTTRDPRPVTRDISIITAGTADLPVAEEAAVTAEFLGLKVERLFDVGVAGIHRLVNNLDKLKKARVVIVIAGMEGALPSVLGGLIDKPIIAVPTSVGYGASFKGLSALLTMLNSCAPGIAVVNIDNGFGAAVMAYSILKQIKRSGL
ncbi:MAG: nickel pincer cofactor biosynthesis protein LarB [Candidatus Saganbacteria bacterium]|nr:nickel pincer cofactor biosynthesis protein LarB [Candidatus Saganbacteria bacterium]